MVIIPTPHFGQQIEPIACGLQCVLFIDCNTEDLEVWHLLLLKMFIIYNAFCILMVTCYSFSISSLLTFPPMLVRMVFRLPLAILLFLWLSLMKAEIVYFITPHISQYLEMALIDVLYAPDHDSSTSCKTEFF